jgi:putative phosphoesterase
VVHAGDIGHPRVLTELSSSGCEVWSVRGNNDVPSKWPAAAHDQLQRLPRTVEVALPGGVLAVEHGEHRNPVARRHELLRSAYPAARLVLYGHSHRQVIDDAGRPWVVNPGAAGRSRTFGGSGCVMLYARTRQWSLRLFRFPLDDWKGLPGVRKGIG